METRLLEILVCPLCKGPLQHDRDNHELICRPDKLAFPIRDGIPVMLPDEARIITPPNADTEGKKAAQGSTADAADENGDMNPS
ncbi:Trm112 family protein [Allopusillimonas ginsengisoli]|uniref:Trm112 family protein n=1 Tax=Allopusillimonas ginsengisoli TaxID=453575 RepID=UPI0010203EF1|nr:Trm112 family protein [Allopusillimonas ginsengisoli]TEA78070.1 Trm112 family protein [Allopusillimonas ginsengisoli]